MDSLTTLSAWIAASSLSQTIQKTAWIIPSVQSIHILAISIIMASTAMLNLRLVGLIDREGSVQLMARRFLPAVWCALPVLAATGALLIIAEPKRELLNLFFWSKMIMLLVVIALTLSMQSLLEDGPFRQLPPVKRRLVRATAMVCLILWLSIIFCGRWIAYS